MKHFKNELQEIIEALPDDLEIFSSDKIVLLDGEFYKEIIEHPGYHVSPSGKVLGPRGHLLKLEEHYSGYYKVHIRDNKCFPHRLVMLTFRPIKGCAFLSITHKDGDKKHNHIDNLEWSTERENTEKYQKIKLKEKITEQVKDAILALPSGFNREDLDKILNHL